MKSKRKFNGKTYKLGATKTTKGAADAMVKKLRKGGVAARSVSAVDAIATRQTGKKKTRYGVYSR